MTAPSRVTFLNEEADISSANIWEDASRSKLWLYNLHYFNDLVADGAGNRLAWHRNLIRRWIDENPAGKGTGWEPYPTSLRIVNWLKWHLSHGQLDEPAVHSLAVQTRHLARRLEYHVLGNHLLANAKALLFAGAFFQSKEGEHWLDAARALLTREIGEQVLPDGGHIERSPLYHLIALEDLLDCSNLCRTYGVAPPDGLDTAIIRMSRWSRVMRHPDGEIPFFNDAAFGVAPSPRELDAYALRLGYPEGESRFASTEHLASSGYARLGKGAAVLLANMASIAPHYQPGHAHADTLSFELSLGGVRAIVNGGTSEYGTGKERLRQRGTPAHNTLVLDGSNSSEVWAGFRVARRARVFGGHVGEENGTAYASASHDGFRFLRGRPIHRRSWRLTKDGLTIEDCVEGKGRHRLEIMFHLHPDVTVEQTADCPVLHLANGAKSRVVQPANAAIQVQESTWHPGFGLSVPSQSLCISASAELPVRLVTRLELQGAEER